jgi:hypothetical protein
LREMALGAGAREVHVHTGDALSIRYFSLLNVKPPANES